MNRWSSAATVAGFVSSPPNTNLLAFAQAEKARGATRLLDIGCGAARNALPLALAGWRVLALDTSLEMLAAAASRPETKAVPVRLGLTAAAMDELPLPDASADLIVAHGIWNLARSAAEFRRALTEAARVARAGAGLFVFTFSRATLPATAHPVSGETFIFTQFAGEPQCFLTADELTEELAAAGFASESAVPLRELNRGSRLASSGPVLLEGGFRRCVGTTRATTRAATDPGPLPRC